MTLIMTVATADKAVQASDRRLTSVNSNSFEDDRNKALCIRCSDAHFSVAYTGVAFIDSKRTDEWILDYLISIRAFRMTASDISKALGKHRTATFGSIHHKFNKKLTLVLSGFRRSVPFVMHISNFERENIWPHGEAQDEFLRYVRWGKKNSNLEKGYCFAINGNQRAVSREILWKIKALLRSGFFQMAESMVVAERLVSFIREAAGTPKQGSSVGRNCMVVTMTLNAHDGFVSKYYPDEVSPCQYAPHLITPPGVAIKGFQSWTGQGPPPWRSTSRKR